MSSPATSPNTSPHLIYDCHEPTCQYSKSLGSLSGIGWCICDKTFCKDHFDNHVCKVAEDALNAEDPLLLNERRE